MASQEPSLSPDPRLKKPAHYNREEIISDLFSFYNFLPHIPSSYVHSAPPGGWEVITESSLAAHDIQKTPEAVALLRHLPYIDGHEPWVMYTALVCDYRVLTVLPKAREKPGWLFDAADKQFPAWVVQLTSGTDREGHQYMLDTMDGTVTRYCAGSGYTFEPVYGKDDPRAWRNECDPETVTLKDLLEKWRQRYRKMTVLGVPPSTTAYPLNSSPYNCFGKLDANPDDYLYEEMKALRSIYREHGWPDMENYKKEECVQALRDWWQNRRRSRR